MANGACKKLSCFVSQNTSTSSSQTALGLTDGLAQNVRACVPGWGLQQKTGFCDRAGATRLQGAQNAVRQGFATKLARQGGRRGFVTRWGPTLATNQGFGPWPEVDRSLHDLWDLGRPCGILPRIDSDSSTWERGSSSTDGSADGVQWQSFRPTVTYA